MSVEQNVVTCFVLYEGKEIVSQGSFQVLDEVGTYTFPSTDESELEFTHSYEGSTCAVAISFQRHGTTMYSLELAVPINRSKIKWKQANLGAGYELFYRSQFEAASLRSNYTR